MRIAFKEQPTFDCPTPQHVLLNLNCRDEIVPILRGLQYIYSDPKVRHSVLTLVGKDVNRNSSKKLGRKGLDYWEITVLAAVRLGCNLTASAYQTCVSDRTSVRNAVLAMHETILPRRLSFLG